MKATLFLSIILLMSGAALSSEVYYNLHEGWNLLAMPLEMDMREIGDSLPIEVPGTYYSPDSGYHIAREMSRPCRGFWAMSRADTVCTVAGEAYDGSVGLTLSRGWNLIAMPDYRPGVAINSLLPIIPPAYLFDSESGDYTAITNFPPPNAGFWVLCDGGYSTSIDYDTAGFSIIGLDSVARDISLGIYSDGWGWRLDSCMLSIEKDTSFHIDEDTLGSSIGYEGQYYLYARAEGFYTEIYQVVRDEIVLIDLDPITPLANSIALVFIGKQGYFADHYVMPDNPVNLYQDSVFIRSTLTDSMGRAFFDDLPIGDYLVEFPYHDPFFWHWYPDSVFDTFYFDISNTIGTDYYECDFWDPMQAFAPYIYLYPETTSVVDVSLVFHNPGHVTASEPPYGDGWSVEVEPTGIIDGEFDYLFYEADYSSEMQITHAWTVRADTLEAAFRNLLTQYGCVGREIEDFVDFWMPYFADYEYYMIFPQDESAMVGLDISPEPDNILRIYFSIRGFDSAIFLEEPAPPPPFIREGFVAVEWGVTTDAAEVEH